MRQHTWIFFGVLQKPGPGLLQDVSSSARHLAAQGTEKAAMGLGSGGLTLKN